MGTLWQKSHQIELDQNAERAAAAKAYFFDAGTTTPRTTYQDATLATPHPHPIVADGNGRWPAVFLQFGDYKCQARTAGGVQLWSTDGISNDAPTNPAQSVPQPERLSTGDVIWRPTKDTRQGCVRLNGRTIGNPASGATERANTDTLALFEFLYGLPDSICPVSGGRSNSAPADFAANKTITLLDARGGLLFGLDDMGSIAAGRFTGVPFGTGNATTEGATAGANTHSLTTGELASHLHAIVVTTDSQGSHQHSFTATTTANGTHNHWGGTGGASHGHVHTVTRDDQGNELRVRSVAAGGDFVAIGVTSGLPVSLPTGPQSVDHAHNYSTSTVGDHQHTASGQTAVIGGHVHAIADDTELTGGGAAHNNVSRGILGTFYMKL